MTRCFYVTPVVMLLCVAAPAGAADERFELRDGDRVVMIGNTFIEREQDDSYLETLLRTRWPDRKITFRNIGWSGDTVFGDSRSIYDGVKGLDRLDQLVHELKPTVFFIGYGMIESFDGEAGLSRFREGLTALMDMLKNLDARMVLIGPIRHETLAPPMPDPAEHNRVLRLYADVIADVARGRGHRFVDLFDALGDGVTDNGIHLTPYGYWRASGAIADALELSPGASMPKLGTSKRPVPACAPPTGAPRKGLPGWERSVVVKDLKPGRYVLTANGEQVASASADGWAKGIEILDDPAARRTDQIRALTIQKNIQFFNQYRPANEPYIFGFRKAEQSRNRVEMPRFNQPIERLEDEITKLAQPIEVTYELKPTQ